MTFDPGNRLIVALDVPDRQAADALVDRLDGVPSWIKIGLELFVAEGPQIVRDYVARGYRVMLDLKLHDIPATVLGAAGRAAVLGAELLTIHTGGGTAMMEAAVQATREHSKGVRMRILGVTALTSLDDRDLADVGIAEGMGSLVVRRAKLAVKAGCDGVVASPREAGLLRGEVPADFLIITPGVRPAGVDVADQKRVMTPSDARAAGADMVVIGRPVRNADDPAAASRAIVAELES